MTSGLNDLRLKFELLEGFKQGFIVRLEHKTFAPNGACFFFVAHHPMHFAQVRCNFCIGPFFEGGFQNTQGFLIVAHTVFKPTSAVLNKGIARCQLNGLQNQFACFVQSDFSVGQGITQSVEGMRVAGFDFHEVAQQTFHLLVAT